MALDYYPTSALPVSPSFSRVSMIAVNRQDGPPPLPESRQDLPPDHVLGEDVTQTPEEGGSGATKVQTIVAKSVWKTCRDWVRDALTETLDRISQHTGLSPEVLLRRAGYPGRDAMEKDFEKAVAESHAKVSLTTEPEVPGAFPIPYAEMTDAFRSKILAVYPDLGLTDVI